MSHCRFSPTRIWTCMTTCFDVNGCQQIFALAKAKQNCAEARRQPIQKIIDASRCFAEFFVKIRLVTDHRVERIGSSINQSARRSADHRPEQRGDDPVGQTFGNALDHGSGYLGFVKRLRVSSDDKRKSLTRLDQVVAKERSENGLGVAMKILCGNRLINDYGIENKHCA